MSSTHRKVGGPIFMHANMSMDNILNLALLQGSSLQRTLKVTPSKKLLSLPKGLAGKFKEMEAALAVCV